MIHYRVRLAAPFIVAFRDARAGFAKLLAFVLLASLGLGLLSAILSTVQSIESYIDSSARDLAGGDIVIGAPILIPRLDFGAGAHISSEIRLRTMVQGGSGAALAEVRGIEANYPLAGTFETVPPLGGPLTAGAVAERALLDRLGLRVGDVVTIFSKPVQIRGELIAATGSFSASAVAAPRLYLPRDLIPTEILERTGSLASYYLYVALAESSEAPEVARKLRARPDMARYDVNTAPERAERMSRAVSNVGSLAAAVALASTLLALLGTAVAMRTYMRSKHETVALLRCVGATRYTILAIYVIQLSLLAVAAGLFSTVLNWIFLGAFRSVAARVAGPSLTLDASTGVLFATLMLGGVLVAWVAWPPLAWIARVSGLLIFRADIEPGTPDRARTVVHGASGILILAAGWLASGANKAGGFLLLGAVVAGVLFYLVAIGVQALVRRVSDRSASATVRLALRNLVRPGNQTKQLLVTISIAIALTTAIAAIESTLDVTRELGTSIGSANFFLYELDPADAETAEAEVMRRGGTIVQNLPVVLMRIQSIRGESVQTVLARPDAPARWSVTREYWTSYRAEQQQNERVEEGKWIPSFDGKGAVPISIENELAQRLKVGMGDRIVWDIHGTGVETYIASVRDILWERFDRNSFIVFPTGVLESAPQFLFWSIHVPEAADRSALVRELSEKLPGVSVIDMTLVVDSVLKLLEKVGIALKALLGLMVATAWTLLIIVILNSRVERRAEFQMLRRIGMRSNQLRSMVGVELLFLIVIAVAIGLLSGAAIGWGVAEFALKLPFAFNWQVSGVVCVAAMVTAVLGVRVIVAGWRRMV